MTISALTVDFSLVVTRVVLVRDSWHEYMECQCHVYCIEHTTDQLHVAHMKCTHADAIDVIN